MSLTPAIIDAMVASGCTVEQMAAVMKAALSGDDARKADKRAKDAERQRRCRSNNTSKSRNVTVTNRDERDAPPPNDIYSNPPPVTPSAKADDPLPDFSDRVVEDWNRQIAGTPLPQARKLNPDRRKRLRCRVAEHGEPAVLAAIGAMCRSDFHSGRSGKWTEGSLGWLLKSPENFQKMLERADSEAAKPQPAPKASIAGGSLFAKLQAGEISRDEFDAERARLQAASEHPPPRRDRPQSGSIAKFIPRIGSAA